jgi:hypothetical protein
VPVAARVVIKKNPKKRVARFMSVAPVTPVVVIFKKPTRGGSRLRPFRVALVPCGMLSKKFELVAIKKSKSSGETIKKRMY